MSRLNQPHIYVVGLVRDLGSSIQKEVTRIDEIFSSLGRVSWMLIESDSRDHSLLELRDLVSKMPNFSFRSLGNLERQEPNRIRRLALCRNQYMEFLSGLDRDSKPDWVAVMDLDGAVPLLSKEIIQKTLLRGDADAYAANQKGPYYDIYALRATGWVESDPFVEYQELLDRGLNRKDAYGSAITQKMLVIDSSEPPITVQSAFGGLVLYRAERFLRCIYSAVNDDGEIECEHVSLNKNFTDAGGRLVIDPQLVVAGYNQHTRYMRPFRKLVQPLIGGIRIVSNFILGESLTHRIGIWLFAHTGL